MSAPPSPPERLQEAVDAIARHGSQAAAARAIGVKRCTLQDRLKQAKKRGFKPQHGKPFQIAELPPELLPVEDLIARRKAQFVQKDAAARSRALVPVKIKISGPIGIVHMGDPHVDDDGTDIIALERHVSIINKTEGLFGANVGDLQNNWVGRLAHLWSQQSTSAAEAWQLTEWLVSSVDWLYLIAGNHDLWTGEGDPLKWMTRDRPGLFEAWGVRLGLTFPGGRQVRVNARHDFSGHSMWNTAHGPAKAIQMGWRDHILTCGHQHTSGYQVLKDPSTGLVSHAIRCGSFKVHDRYAKEKGLPNQNIFPSAMTIIDPRWDDDDPRLITTLFDVETGADFLTFLRRKKSA